MKRHLLILTILLMTHFNFLQGQCITDAGQDKVICNGWWGMDTTQIGGNPTASGGIPPYTYAWETTHTITIGQYTYTYTASDFLNDTTLANPLFIYTNGDPLVFILTVTDSNSNVCKDTVNIKFTNFGTHLGNVSYNIQQGDSIYLQGMTNVFGGFPPHQYLWHPNYGLSDSTSLSFWASPDSSVAYYLTLTDSSGCVAVGAPVYYIYVYPLSINQIDKQNIQVSVFPNPFSFNTTLQTDRILKDATLTVYNSFGQQVKQIKNISGQSIILQRDNLPSGLYFIRLIQDNKTLTTEKLLITDY